MIKRWKIGLDRVPRQDAGNRRFCPRCNRRLIGLNRAEFRRHVVTCNGNGRKGACHREVT